jgi:hypothetical protein
MGHKKQVRTSQKTHYFSATELSQLLLCKIWGFYGSGYEEWRLLGYKKPVRTSQETHYFSATESSRLMLCKIWGIHGGNYEEYRLQGYKKPVRTSQETNYFPTTGPSRLMLCQFWGFHGGDYDERHPLRYYAVWLGRTDVSEERNASIIRETQIGALGTTLPLTSDRST